MFPIIIYDGKTPLPEDKSIYYLVTKNGIYLYKNINTIRSLTKVETISFLKKQDGFAELKIPKIPKEIIAQAVGYFLYVYQICYSESGLILYLYPKEGRYELYCPKQEVSRGSISWNNKNEKIPLGAIRICSIHSHASIEAFHSPTDKEDEENFDGIHIIIGHINENFHSITATIVVNGNRFKLNKNEISKYIDIELINSDDNYEQEFNSGPIYEDYQATISKHNTHDITSCNFKRWVRYTDELNFKLNVQLSDYKFPDEWKERFKYKEIPEFCHLDLKFGRFIDRCYDYNQYNWSNNYNNIREYLDNCYLEDKDEVRLASQQELEEYNIKYDENGKMVDSDGKIIEVLSTD